MPRTTVIARAGGTLAILASAVLLVRVAAIGELEETAVWVFGLAAVAGGLALYRPWHPSVLMAACVVLVIALLPAVRSWVALVYLPPFALIAWATYRISVQEARRIRVQGYEDEDEDGG